VQRHGLDSNSSEQDPLAGSSEHRDELSSSIKPGNILSS